MRHARRRTHTPSSRQTRKCRSLCLPCKACVRPACATTYLTSAWSTFLVIKATALGLRDNQREPCCAESAPQYRQPASKARFSERSSKLMTPSNMRSTARGQSARFVKNGIGDGELLEMLPPLTVIPNGGLIHRALPGNRRRRQWHE